MDEDKGITDNELTIELVEEETGEEKEKEKGKDKKKEKEEEEPDPEKVNKIF
jgi:hypothetical protein